MEVGEPLHKSTSPLAGLRRRLDSREPYSVVNEPFVQTWRVTVRERNSAIGVNFSTERSLPAMSQARAARGASRWLLCSRAWSAAAAKRAASLDSTNECGVPPQPRLERQARSDARSIYPGPRRPVGLTGAFLVSIALVYWAPLLTVSNMRESSHWRDLPAPALSRRPRSYLELMIAAQELRLEPTSRLRSTSRN